MQRSYNMNTLLYPRAMPDEDLVQLAMKEGKLTKFGTLNAHYRLYRGEVGWVLYFTNSMQDGSILCTDFDLELTNLRLKGEPLETTSF